MRAVLGGMREATSVFVGGGTPSLLPPSQMVQILAAIPRADDAEVTIGGGRYAQFGARFHRDLHLPRARCDQSVVIHHPAKSLADLPTTYPKTDRQGNSGRRIRSAPLEPNLRECHHDIDSHLCIFHRRIHPARIAIDARRVEDVAR